MVISLIKQK